MKYILVTGGGISGIGKGVFTSSLGALLKCYGVRVTVIKIDPYLNHDAGTISPYEHGEVYVLDDGGEVDLDLGNYERFLDITLRSGNNITTGKIYQDVTNKERTGVYLGKTVQVVPHVTNAIQEWVEKEAKRPVTPDNEEPQVCIIELGGTIGDIESMPFVEAFRHFQSRRVGKENFFVVHLTYVPELDEQKTKPTQTSVRELRRLGLSSDLIVCSRSTNPIGDCVKEKISCFCDVEPSQVVGIPDCSSIYRVPLLLQDQGVVDTLREKLHLAIPLPTPPNLMVKWKALAERDEQLSETVIIALVGKYTKLKDSYASVTKALRHAAGFVQRKLDLRYVDAEDIEESTESSDPIKYHDAWKALRGADGILVPGGFGQRGVEGKILAAQWCRKNNKPFLGICLGLQAAVIEFARNVLNWKDANSKEFCQDTPYPVVIEMPEHHTGKMGGTMRLGRRVTVFQPGHESVLKRLYGDVNQIEERHRHRYEVNPQFIDEFEAAGLMFVGKDETGQRMEIIELKHHPFYAAVQFHPEYLSRPLRPSPTYLSLILAATGLTESHLANMKGLKNQEPLSMF